MFILNELRGNSFMIFCSTCNSTQRLSLLLRDLGFNAICLHGPPFPPATRASLSLCLYLPRPPHTHTHTHRRLGLAFQPRAPAPAVSTGWGCTALPCPALPFFPRRRCVAVLRASPPSSSPPSSSPFFPFAVSDAGAFVVRWRGVKRRRLFLVACRPDEPAQAAWGAVKVLSAASQHHCRHGRCQPRARHPPRRLRRQLCTATSTLFWTIFTLFSA